MNATTRPLNSFEYMSFDVIGTIIDFETPMLQAMEAPAREAGVTLTPDQIFGTYMNARKMEGAIRCPDDLPRCYYLMAEKLGLPNTRAYQNAFQDTMVESQPFADSVEALTRLSKHYKLIAMTNVRRWGLERILPKLDYPFWDTISSDDAGCEKPDPRFFETALSRVEADGAGKQNWIHTAQSQYHDMAVSRAFGLTNCWIERRHAQEGYGGSPTPEVFTKPDYHFHSLSALADAVDAAF